MATKKTTQVDKLDKAKAIVKKLNNDLIDASFNAIENTVKTGEKWQKLTAKLLKKAEPLTKKQKEMMVETAESLKGQLETSTERLKKLVGYDPKVVESAKKMVAEHPLVEKAEEMKNKIEKEVANNKYVKKAEKISTELKQNLMTTIAEVKGKINEYTDVTTEEKVTKTKTTTKKKAAPKKAVEKVIVEKTETVDDLKVIKGIGPVLEQSLNELNITSYAQIAKISIKDLTKLLDDAGINSKIYDLNGWIAQAKLALKGDFEAIKNWGKENA